MIHDGKNSLNLKKINVEDAYAQWQYTTNLPEDENGLTNKFCSKFGTSSEIEQIPKQVLF